MFKRAAKLSGWVFLFITVVGMMISGLGFQWSGWWIGPLVGLILGKITWVLAVLRQY